MRDWEGAVGGWVAEARLWTVSLEGWLLPRERLERESLAAPGVGRQTEGRAVCRARRRVPGVAGGWKGTLPVPRVPPYL